MLPALYSPAAGMLAQLDKQDVIANNLANVNTAGFKRTSVGFTSFCAQLNRAEAGVAGCVVPVPVSGPDNRQGAIHDTGVPTNVALDGPGFFVVQGESGEETIRGGSFRLDSDGTLVTADGRPVLGERGPIQVGGADWSVDTDGSVRMSGVVMDKIRIETADGTPAQQTRVVLGGVEGSNVNVVEEMVSMISAMRAYESCQRAIQSLDQILDKAINQMGQVA